MILLILALVAAVITGLFYFLGVVSSLVWILPLFIGCLLTVTILWLLPCLLASIAIDKSKPMERFNPFYFTYAHWVIDLVIAFLRVKLTVKGLEKLPEGRFLFVGNHRSFLDPVVEIKIFRKQRVAFVAKKELFDIFFIGRLIHSIFCLSLNRGTPKDEVQTILRAVQMIKNGQASIGIYPEGTRNHGDGLLPFKNGAFKIAQRAKCPIVVGVIRNSDQIKKNFPLKRTHVVVEILQVLDTDYVASHNTVEVGNDVREIMLSALADN